jgi:hypothetical protein
VTGAASRSDPTVLPVSLEAVAEQAFEQVYRSDYRRLVALAYGLSGSRAAAEELAQEAFWPPTAGGTRSARTTTRRRGCAVSWSTAA